MDPLKLLQEDCTDDDRETQILALRRLTAIATALGPVRTRNELLPYLRELVNDDNDELQATIAEHLANVADLIGGTVHIPLLLPILEFLCATEESVVRESAVATLNSLMSKVKADVMQAKFLPMIKRLAAGEWFTTRVSVAGLFAKAYPHVKEPQQAEMRVLYASFVNDDTPMVRKSAFIHLGAFASTVDIPSIKTAIIPLLKLIATDDSDPMRAFTVRTVAALAKKFDASDYTQLLQPFVDALLTDRSWRVRLSLCEYLQQIANSIDSQSAAKHLLPVYSKLLSDLEPEVRTAAVELVTAMSKVCKDRAALITHLSGPIEALATDSNDIARAHVAEAMGGLVEHFGKEQSIKLIIPLIETMSKDESLDVRTKLVLNIDSIGATLGDATLNDVLLPVLLSLIKDANWRVRKAVIDKIANISKRIGVKTYEKRLHESIILSLSDHVYAIRESACKQIGILVKAFGGVWAAKELFPAAFSIFDKGSNYLHRMTCLSVMHNSSPHLTAELVTKHFLPLLNTCVGDDVANVRIYTAETLLVVSKQLDAKTVSSKIKPLLTQMRKDGDADVVHAASKSLLSL